MLKSNQHNAILRNVYSCPKIFSRASNSVLRSLFINILNIQYLTNNLTLCKFQRPVLKFLHIPVVNYMLTRLPFFTRASRLCQHNTIVQLIGYKYVKLHVTYIRTGTTLAHSHGDYHRSLTA